MGYESVGGFPLSGSLPFKGSGALNGQPVNTVNAGYKTIGGSVLSSDANNDGLTAYFGLVVSSDPAGDPGNLALGKPSGYVLRGILMSDNSIAQNDPAKATYYLQDTPATVMYEGTATYQSWTATQAGAGDPELGSQIIYRALPTGTGAAPIGSLEFVPVGAAPTGWAIFPGYVVQVATDGVKIAMSFDTNFNSSLVSGAIDDFSALQGIPFTKTATLTSAAAATPVHVLADADVGTLTAHVTQVILKVNGATAWTDSTGTIVTLQDTAGSPVVGATYAKAQLTGNALLGVASTGVTLAAPISTNAGFTAAKGLDIVADHTFAAGSDIVVTVTGYLA